MVNIQCEVNFKQTMQEQMIFWSRERDPQISRIMDSNLHFDQLVASDAVSYFCHASFGSAMGKERLTITANCKLDIKIVLNISL